MSPANPRSSDALDRRDQNPGEIDRAGRSESESSDLFSHYPVDPELIPEGEFTAGRYSARFVRTAAEVDAILRLRFEVFNLEMNEGLAESFDLGRDVDAFDPHCHHLLVVDQHEGGVVGTYRMQTSEMAARGAGFYTANEFDMDAIPEQIRASSMEVGRACIHRDHRNRQVLFLLWRGLAAYVLSTGKRYFFGCSSINSQDPDEGLALHRQLTDAGMVNTQFSAQPRPALVCVADQSWNDDRTVEVPALFRTYLRYGAKVCSPPAMDREFKTIDFLVLLDTEALSDRSRQIFFAT